MKTEVAPGARCEDTRNYVNYAMIALSTDSNAPQSHPILSRGVIFLLCWCLFSSRPETFDDNLSRRAADLLISSPSDSRARLGGRATIVLCMRIWRRRVTRRIRCQVHVDMFASLPIQIVGLFVSWISTSVFLNRDCTLSTRKMKRKLL
jgi:hypothetical protein